MRRLTWKRISQRFHFGECFVLNYGADNVVAHVAAIGPITDVKYYWYGLGRNTASTPCKTVEDCRVECLEYVRSRLDDLRKKFKESDK